MEKKNISPWLWVPTLYFAEGIPYFAVNTISVVMFTKMGVSNGSMALFTSLLYLPWVIKPLWSPFVDILRTKRWWVMAMQILMSACFIGLALSLPSGSAALDAHRAADGSVPVSLFTLTLIIFWLMAFASATHDIAADGFYMLALTPGDQSLFVGIRSTFYRLASVFGQGVLVVVAGVLESRFDDIPKSWFWTILSTSVLFAVITLWHSFFLPRPASDGRHSASGESLSGNNVSGASSSGNPVSGTSSQGRSVSGTSSQGRSAKLIFKDFGRTFATFFKKKGIVTALLFLLLYRLPEAFLVKMMNPFLLSSIQDGGLGLTTTQVGAVYGTAGVIALTVGGILGGMAVAKWGLKRCLYPMALSLALPCLAFLYLSIAQPSSLWVTVTLVCLDQFGYGFGFTAYMLYMIYFSRGEYSTSHYSMCTAFMALSMMLPGMVAGFLQERLGYVGFFAMVGVCCFTTVFVSKLLNIEPEYGKK